MKPIFTNKTTYSKDIYMDFLEFHSKTFMLSYLLKTIPIVGVILIIIILHFSNLIIPSAIILIIMLLLYIAYKFLKPIQEVKKDFKSDIIKKQDFFTFCFYEKFFTICKNTEIENIQNNTKIDEFFYCNIYKIFETKNFFYLYIDDSHSFILNKSYFSKDIDIVRDFLDTKHKVTHKNF